MSIVYLAAWLWYALRMPFSLLHSLLSFISKPGSRYVVAGALAIGAVVLFEPLHWRFASIVHDAHFRDEREPVLLAFMVLITLAAPLSNFRSPRKARPALMLAFVGWLLVLYPPGRASVIDFVPPLANALTFAVLLAAALAIVWLAYWLISKSLALVLGAFPPPSRPLPPRRTLKARNRVIVPAPVRLAVPTLPPRTAPAGYDLRAALPQAVAALLPNRNPSAAVNSLAPRGAVSVSARSEATLGNVKEGA